MSYIITEQTSAIIPKGNNTQIIEEKKNFLISETVQDIIIKNCYYYGSSLEGRQKGSAYLLGSNYKPPIILKETANLIFIPTHSNRNKKCCWINLNNLLNYYPNSEKTVLIEFKNLKKIILNVSYYLFDKQVLRATRLESILRGRNVKKPL